MASSHPYLDCSCTQLPVVYCLICLLAFKYISRMTAPPSIAHSPFDDTTANTVLRSCDNVDFYVYKEVLKLASPFFDTLFSLPQPAPAPVSDQDSTTEDEFSPEGLPIIPVPEESGVLDYILRICYPHPNPEQLSSLFLAERTLIAALKYEIEAVIEIARDDFIREGSKSPVQMYMFSCRQNLENEAQIAANLLRNSYNLAGWGKPSPTNADFVRIGIQIYSDDFGQLPAIYLYRLLRHICFDDGGPFCVCDTSVDTNAQNDDESHWDLSTELQAILTDYPADIFLQSSDGIIIPTHKIFLRVASASSILSQSKEADCPRRNGIPMVKLQHPTDVLTKLVRACYVPLDHTARRLHVDDDLRLFHAAQFYNMRGIAFAAKSRWLSNVAADSLTVYMVASSNGWTEEAKRAARDVVLDEISICTRRVPEMNIGGTARHYYALLKHSDALKQGLQAVKQY
ncbi:hypothetical protein QCA50_019190 [Cerrena zonata]|uniref:BTB domain-containing protein n=1 Tax=Cerrena zonata TaxID=2478898 RepID=A0AAW0FB81_9APHY